MAVRQPALRRPTPREDARSWLGVVVWWVGAALGLASSLGALIFGLYVLSYAEHDLWFGGSSYGCDSRACTGAHVGAALLCLGSIAVYAVLLALAPFTSVRALRTAARLGLVWAAVMVALAVVGGWSGLALLAVSPALMGTASQMRLRAKRRWLRG